MRLNTLLVRNFRNIQEIEFEAGPELTLICGENGQGKTSLLEAIWSLTGSKSFRGAKDMELVRHGEARALVEGDVHTGGQDKSIRVDVYGPGEGKRGRYASVNGVPYGRASEIAGTFNAVVFYPDHLRLIKGSPDGRRRFIDAALCQLFPGYVAILRRYNRALSQKNALLKSFYKTQNADVLLDAFDSELISAGIEMTKRRQIFAEKAGVIAEKYYDEITGSREQLAIKYIPCCAPEQYADKIKAARGADVKTGFSTFGSHREDLEILINDKSAKSFASQGQQRSGVLCLKLAEAAFVKEVTHRQPVMLLDDVLSELDAGRKEYLLYRMSGIQSFISSCEAEVSGGMQIKIHGGAIQNSD